MKKIVFAALLGWSASPAIAQDPESVPVAAPVLASEGDLADYLLPDRADIAMPELAFEPSSGDIGDFDKYYYFHRDETDLEEAFVDISECDALASGITYFANTSEPYTGYYASQYGIGGVIGGVIGSAIGSALADAIHGSAARRRIRRINMRNCMGFKGYNRYGISKDLWLEFNFEEGRGREPEEERHAALLQQALVASGIKPSAQELEI